MLPIELDHVFCFSSPALPEAKLMEERGFRVNAGRRHPGQGTANRCVVFRENYLEFIFVDHEEEAKSNPLQLYRRAQWQKTGASPFGIALRGTLSEEERQQFWEYRPSYMQSGPILVLKTDSDRGPLLFIVPPRGDTLSAMYPMNWPNIDRHLLEHTTQTSKITSIRLTGPGYQWPLTTSIPNIMMTTSTDPHLEVFIDGNMKAKSSLNGLVSIVSI